MTVATPATSYVDDRPFNGVTSEGKPSPATKHCWMRSATGWGSPGPRRAATRAPCGRVHCAGRRENECCRGLMLAAQCEGREGDHGSRGPEHRRRATPLCRRAFVSARRVCSVATARRARSCPPFALLAEGPVPARDAEIREFMSGNPLPLRRLSEHRGRHQRGRRAMSGFGRVRPARRDVAAAVALVSSDPPRPAVSRPAGHDPDRLESSRNGVLEPRATGRHHASTAPWDHPRAADCARRRGG